MWKLKFKISTVVTTAMFTLLTVAVIVQSLQIAALTSFFSHEADGTLWNTKLIYACYNHKIYPCNESGVSRWNEQNPDKAITEAYLRDPEL
jgi:ABC-type phosphate transport system substrate-binding protein